MLKEVYLLDLYSNTIEYVLISYLITEPNSLLNIIL